MAKLSLVARSVYAIPAMQNKSERAFSGAGHVLTVLLTSMDPMLVNCCRSGLTTGRLMSKTNIAMTAIMINPFIAIQ